MTPLLDINEITSEIRRRVEQRFPHSRADTTDPATLAAAEWTPKSGLGLTGSFMDRSPLTLTKKLEDAVSRGYALIGRFPPQPESLRGKLGAVLVHAVRRTLFWYTPQIQEFQVSVAAALQEQADAITELGAEVDVLNHELTRAARNYLAQQSSILALQTELAELKQTTPRIPGPDERQ